MKLIGDNAVLELVEKADREYLLHQKEFEMQQSVNDSEPLYEKLTKFDEYDSLYYKLHDETMALIEKYAERMQENFLN